MPTSPLYNGNNVKVGQIAVWLAAWTPAGPLVALPADTVLPFNPWTAPVGWTSVGGTNEGFKINADTSITDINIEEQSSPVAQQVNARSLNLTAALAEDTLESMRLSWGGGTITATTGRRTMALSDQIQYYTLGADMFNAAGFTRRIYIPKVGISGSGDVEFRRAAGARLYPVAIKSLCAPDQIQVVDFLTSTGA